MDNLPVNLTDLLVLAVIVISGAFAFMRGLVHELLAVGSWIGAAFATLYGFPHVQPLANTYISVKILADVSAGVVIFLLVLVILTLGTRLLSHRVRESSLGPLDRTLGLLFGFLRGAVLVCLAWLVFTWALPREDWPDWISEAKSQPFIERGSILILSLVPPELIDRSGEAAEESRRKALDAKAALDAYDQLKNPLGDSQRKDDATSTQPEYNDQMRDVLQRVIDETAEENAQTGASAQ